MRAVNLLPSDDRRIAVPAGRLSVAHLVIGGLAAALIAVLAVVMTGNKISDRTSQVAKLENEERELAAKADALESFSAFRTMEEQRATTVSSLAKSRFDWERVMRELALVLPSDVWLVKLTGTVKPDVQIDEAASLSARGGVTGPALEIVGCTVSQDAVAGFVSALEDIDGVTRVGVQSSEKAEQAVSGASTGAGTGGDDCRTRDFIAKFELVVAFDEAPVAAATAAPAVPAPAPTDGSTPTPASTSTGE